MVLINYKFTCYILTGIFIYNVDTEYMQFYYCNTHVRLYIPPVYIYRFSIVILMLTCTLYIYTGLVQLYLCHQYYNNRYPGRPVDRDHQDPPTPPLHALPTIPGLRRESVAQSIMGRHDRRGPADQGTAEGLGEIRGYSGARGAREAGEERGGVSSGPSGG